MVHISFGIQKLRQWQFGKAIVWLIGLIVATAAAIWLHVTIGGTGRIYAGVEQACMWVIYAALYLLFMWPLSTKLAGKIHDLAAPADSDKEGTKRLASAIAISVIAGSTMIVLLLVFDYLGHASAAIASPPGQGSPTAGAVGTELLTGQSFLQDVGRYLGTFGDFFGGVVNPILTFGTLIGLAITILLQRVQIREARAEASANRDYAQTQAFETTFFNLLNLHTENIQNLAFDPAVIPTPRNPAIDRLRQLADLELSPAQSSTKVEGRAVFGEVLRSTVRGSTAGYSQLDVYRTLQRDHNDVLGHYFRHLYQILNLVNSFVVEGDKAKQYKTRKRYTNILRAQLSAHELAVLLLNCTFRTVDEGKFRNLIVWYKFFEHLPLKVIKGELTVPGIAQDSHSIVFEYFDKGFTKDGSPIWLPGAFGKHPVVSNYLKQQGAAWQGPVPWTPAGGHL